MESDYTIFKVFLVVFLVLLIANFLVLNRTVWRGSAEHGFILLASRNTNKRSHNTNLNIAPKNYYPRRLRDLFWFCQLSACSNKWKQMVHRSQAWVLVFQLAATFECSQNWVLSKRAKRIHRFRSEFTKGEYVCFALYINHLPSFILHKWKPTLFLLVPASVVRRLLWSSSAAIAEEKEAN